MASVKKNTEIKEEVLADGTKRTTTVVTTNTGNQTVVETTVDELWPSGKRSVSTETKRLTQSVSHSGSGGGGKVTEIQVHDDGDKAADTFASEFDRRFDSALRRDRDGHGKQEETAVDLDTFRHEALSSHNAKRRLHGAPPLSLDAGMCDYAQHWAEHMARSGVLEHRPNCDYGENVYMCAGSAPLTGAAVVHKWYDEAAQYDFAKAGSPQLHAGHFTQVVWRASKRLGIGAARRGANAYYVVANYSPTGNVIGDYKDNVKPAGE